MGKLRADSILTPANKVEYSVELEELINDH